MLAANNAHTGWRPVWSARQLYILQGVQVSAEGRPQGQSVDAWRVLLLEDQSARRPVHRRTATTLGRPQQRPTALIDQTILSARTDT